MKQTVLTTRLLESFPTFTSDCLLSVLGGSEEQQADHWIVYFQCLVDLRNNKLIIGTTGTETGFLGEGELPDHARLNKNPEQMEASQDEDRQLAEALATSAAEAAGQTGLWCPPPIYVFL